jgi:hypothetical protein
VLALAGALAFACVGKSGPAECNISASSFDQSCTTDSDCVGVSDGNLCEASCTDCTSAAIHTSAQAAYQSALAKLSFSPRVCPCPLVPVYCDHGVCGLTPTDAGP